MPRMDNNRSLPQPYRPANPPAPGNDPGDVIRAVWDEFNRIASAMADLDRPLSVSVRNTDTITVGATASYSTMLNAAPVIDWEQPGGSFNSSTGVWTCAQEGLYQISAAVVSDPFPAPATKSYSVSLRLTRTPLGAGAIDYLFGGGGLDDQFVTASALILLPLTQGDTIVLSAAGVHPTKTGTNTVRASMSIVRVSGVANAN